MLRDISQIVKLYESQIPVITRVDNGAWLFAMDYIVVVVTSNRYMISVRFNSNFNNISTA
jgi:hypothetical protein